MNLKQSEYNFVYDDLGKDQIVIYNSFTGALAVVKEQQYKQFTDYLATGKEIEDKAFLENALKCGYLVPKDIDEHFLIKTRMMQGRYNKNILSLTIAPTMACNFRCVYCFEQGYYGNKLMDENTQENLIKFIEKHINGVKLLNITWFGGEPLLGMPVIENLSEKMIALCEEKQVKYSANIITNGYLLTKNIAQKLKEYRVTFAQVTVDGSKEIHDARRPLANGQGTYDVIMKNMLEINGILQIRLRINVDYENIYEADKVVDFLKDNNMLNTVYPYLGLVISYNNNYQEDRCFSDEMYSKYNLEFLKKHNIPLQTTYPKPRGNYCLSDFNNGWVIDDVGNMYKCWNDIGVPEKVVGNINLGNHYLQRTDLLREYSSFDPITYDECKDCKMLPVCLGGCPHNRMDGRRICEQRRFYMQEYLVECTKSLIAQKNIKTVNNR